MEKQSSSLYQHRVRPLTGEEALHRLVKTSGPIMEQMRKRVADLRSGVHTGLTDLRALAERGDMDAWEILKQERVAVLALLIEDAWMQILRQSEQSESGLFDHFGRPIPVQKLEQSPYPLRDVTDGVHATYSLGLTDWERRMEEEVGTQDSPTHFCYRRYLEMVEATDGFRTPRSAMDSGFTAALGIEHALHDVVPKVFQRQHGRPPTAREFSEILDASYQGFLSIPSLLHREARIDRIQGNLIAITPDEACPRPFRGTMDPQFHALKGHRLVDMRLKNASVMPASLSSLREQQTGCPARYAEATDGKGSIVREFDAFYRKFSDRFHVSRFASEEAA